MPPLPTPLRQERKEMQRDLFWPWEPGVLCSTDRTHHPGVQGENTQPRTCKPDVLINAGIGALFGAEMLSVRELEL